MADVFISYSSFDRAIAQRMVSHLEAGDLTVWWDFQLVGGQDFRKTILQELRRARTAVVIWSEHSINSDYVLDEADEARRANKLVSTIAPGMAVTNLPLGFRNRHVISVNDFDSMRRAVRESILVSMEGELRALKLKRLEKLERELATLRSRSRGCKN